MSEDFGRRLSRANIEREHNCFKIIVQLEINKQLFEAIIPIGDHTQAVPTLTQRCQRWLDIIVDTPNSSFGKTPVNRIEELLRERSGQVRSKDLLHQREPCREGIIEASLELPRVGECGVELIGRNRAIPQFGS